MTRAVLAVLALCALVTAGAALGAPATFSRESS